MENLFQEHAPEVRKQLLEDNCYEIKEDEFYTRPLTEEEIEGHKTELFEVALESREKTDELAEVRKEYKKKLKDLGTRQSQLVRDLEFKQTTEKGTIFLFDDQQSGMMNTYNSQGQFISARPLAPGERQTSIFTVKKNEKNS